MYDTRRGAVEVWNGLQADVYELLTSKDALDNRIRVDLAPLNDLQSKIYAYRNHNDSGDDLGREVPIRPTTRLAGEYDSVGKISGTPSCSGETAENNMESSEKIDIETTGLKREREDTSLLDDEQDRKPSPGLRNIAAWPTPRLASEIKEYIGDADFEKLVCTHAIEIGPKVSYSLRILDEEGNVADTINGILHIRDFVKEATREMNGRPTRSSTDLSEGAIEKLAYISDELKPRKIPGLRNRSNFNAKRINKILKKDLRRSKSKLLKRHHVDVSNDALPYSYKLYVLDSEGYVVMILDTLEMIQEHENELLDARMHRDFKLPGFFQRIDPLDDSHVSSRLIRLGVFSHEELQWLLSKHQLVITPEINLYPLVKGQTEMKTLTTFEDFEGYIRTLPINLLSSRRHQQ